MAKSRFDVVGIGNALVDVIAHTDEAFLVEQHLAKGSMTLIDGGRADALYAAMPPAMEISGGSAANTIAGLASLGGRTAFVGKVSADQLGQVFRHDIRSVGAQFDVPPSVDGLTTGRCLIVVTPDADRTMQTFLGAGSELTPDDVDEELIAGATVTYMEGYLWDPPGAKEAFRKAAKIAHANGRKISFTLSDPFCVERYRAEFRELVEHHVDILFANELEVMSLYETETFDEALRRVRGACEIAALTRSEKGAVIVTGGTLFAIPAEPVDRVVDTTGAGDLYAAGFLYGYTAGMDAQTCGRIGAIAAAEVIGHYGARPETPLRDLVRERVAAAR